MSERERNALSAALWEWTRLCRRRYVLTTFDYLEMLGRHEYELYGRDNAS